MQNWEWRDKWHVDFSKEVGQQIDPSGWEYAIDFMRFSLISKSRTHRYAYLLPRRALRPELSPFCVLIDVGMVFSAISFC